MSHEPPDPFAGPGRDTFTAPDHYSAPAARSEGHRPDDYSPEAIRANLWTDPRSGERLPGAPPIRKATHGDADERLRPAPPRPTPGQIERDVRAAVVHAAVRFCHEAPVDEVRLLAELLRRIEGGRKTYGAWSASGEKRDMAEEEHQEHLDALVYSSMRRVMGRRA